jgi:hypothetical protein
MKNYTFIKPYKTTIGSKDANALLIGAVPFQEINFKIGDKINGTPFGGDDTNRGVETRVGNANLNIPPEYLKEEAVNQPVADAPKEVAYSSVNLSPEEKFYESLGLKDKGGLTLPLKSKGRLLVAVVLVAGYFAYKKYKK